ncbi:MAG: hypothetical protein GXY36_04165 [Chloroflexi bacterium]|nr:hypothetical protein [Chloroflexota bacterium]
MKNKHLPASLKQFVFASMWIAICLLVTCGAVQETSPVAAQTEPNVIWDIAWSPDGTQVAVGSTEGVVRLYTSDFRQSRLLELGVRFAFGLAWSPDGEKLALGTYVPDAPGSEVQVWDISSNTHITTIARDRPDSRSIAWSADSQRIAIADGYLNVWDATSGELLNTLESDTPAVFSVAWSPDGQYLASLGSDDLITVWETTSYSIIRTLAGAAVTDEVIWSPDSTKIASGDRGNVKIWDAATGQVLTTLAAEGIFIQALDWRADTLVNANSIVVGMHGFGRIYIWDVTNERLMRMVDDGVIFAAALSPDGTRVAYGGYRGSLEVIDTPLPGNEPPVADAGPDQTKPSTASAQDADQYYYAYVYQVPAGGPIVIKAVNPNAPTDSMLLYSTNLPDHAPLESALASPDGRWIAVIPRSRGEYLRLIEVATGQMLDVSYHGIPFDFSDGSLLGQFESIVWSPNSQLLAFTSFTSDGTVDVFVYNLADGTLTNLSQDAASQYTLAWSPDSAYLASGGVACDGDECDAQIDIFEWATRSHVVSQHPAWGTYPAIKTMPCQLRWSLESRYLNFVASCDGTIPALEKELFLLDRIQGRVSRLTNYTQTAYQPPEAPVEYPVRLAWYDSVWYDTHTILLGATYGQEVPGDYVIRSQIIEYDLLNDSQTILRSDMTAEEWTPSPVQNLFAFRTASGYSPRTRHGVEIANVAAGVLTTIGSGPAGCDLAWSPDGATLAYTGRGQPMRSCYYSYYSADTLYFMDSLTGQLAQYTPVEMEPVQAVGWVALTAFNVPPTANAGPDQTVTAADGEFAQVLLDGSGSFDSDGTIINYGWYENGELIASGVSPEVTLGLGEHIITLTVDDNNAALRSDTVTVLVTE